MKAVVLLFFILFLNSAHPQSGWVAQNFPQRNFRSVNFVNNLTGYIISTDGFIQKTTNGGINWIEINTGLPGGGATIGSGFFSTANLGSMNSYVGIFTSSNAGLNWISSVPPSNGLLSVMKSRYVNNLVGFSCGNDFIFDQAHNYNFVENIMSGFDGVVYKTTNGGINWGIIFRQVSTDCMDFFLKSEDSIAVLAFQLNKTTNGGINWYSSNFDVSPSIYPRSFTNPYKDTIFVCGNSGRIIRSINGSQSWNYCYSNSNYSFLWQVYFLNSKTGYCVGDSGTILRTSNSGESWTKQLTNTKKVIWNIEFINKDTAYAVGDSGIVLRTFTGGLVSVPYEHFVTPSNFSLSQNYPNPFNPSTIINYQLTINSFVTLNVYDINGKLIKELVNKKQSAGSYSIDFDGSGLPSGTYIYKLQAGDFSETKKMVLLK